VFNTPGASGTVLAFEVNNEISPLRLPSWLVVIAIGKSHIPLNGQVGYVQIQSSLHLRDPLPG
jgi:hypothetical protein